jgi:hypothetical protein
MDLTRAQLHYLSRLDANIAKGQLWIVSHSPSERAMAMRLVEAKILDTSDGHIFERHDPDYYVFIKLLEQAFLAQPETESKTEASGYARWCMEVAQSDGQGGWNYTFKHEPPVWDEALAIKMAARYREYRIDEDGWR